MRRLLSVTLCTLALSGLASAQVVIPGQTAVPVNYNNPANSFSAQSYPADPYGRNIAPYYNSQEAHLPNQAWSQQAGKLVGKADDGNWVVATSGLMPKGSTVAIFRDGRTVNGGQVIDSGGSCAVIKPWATTDLHAGDEVRLQMVAPIANAPVYDKFQVNRPTMQDPMYLYWTDYMHHDFQPGRITTLYTNPGYYPGFYPGYTYPGNRGRVR